MLRTCSAIGTVFLLALMTDSQVEGHTPSHPHTAFYFPFIRPRPHQTPTRNDDEEYLDFEQPMIPVQEGPYIHQTSSGFQHSFLIVPGPEGFSGVAGLSLPLPYNPEDRRHQNVAFSPSASQFGGAGGFPHVQGPYNPFHMMVPGYMKPHSNGNYNHGYYPNQLQPQQHPFTPFNPPTTRRHHSSCKYFSAQGSCYDSDRCQKKGGKPTVYCRDITKFCCIFKLSCGESTEQTSVYFRNPRFPLTETVSTSCGLTVKRDSKDICFIRIKASDLTLPANIGFCDDISLTVSGVKDKQYEPLCGELTNEEYEVDVRDSRKVTFTVNTNQNLRHVKWNVFISQIPCSDQTGREWPAAGSTSVTGQTSPAEGSTPVVVPSDPAVTSSPDITPVTTQENVPAGKDLTCGVSPVRKTNVRNKGIMLPNRHQQELQSSVANRRQIPIRGEDTDEVEEEEEENKLIDNPDLDSFDWDVPTQNETDLYQYAGLPSVPLTGGRITYGEVTGPHEFPWSVVMYTRRKYHCGATLISDRHVLTAAHCVTRYQKNPQKINLGIGDWNIQSTSDGPHVRRGISKVAVHPGYSTVTLKYDVAVLTLDKRVELTNTTLPVCLPSSDMKLDGRLVTVIGWGRDEKNKLQSKLMKHTANVLSNEVCNQRWKKTGAPDGVIATTMLCMDSQDGDSCKGDSGGASIMEYPPNSGKYIQVGIVSFGSASCTDKKLPGVYTKVGVILDWIKQEMRN